MDSPDLRLVGAFNSHTPGPDCERFETHTHMADGSIRITAYAPHPDRNHEFKTICSLCGQNGWLHVAVITNTERVTISEVE